MAYLRKRRIGNGTYYYILESRRRAGKVYQKTLEYLGRDPDPRRLARALRYWGVTLRSGERPKRKDMP
jgi:hypothetical protein